MVSKKIDVKFEKGQVTSKSFEQAKFNKTLTEKECKTCREDDEVGHLFFVHILYFL